MDHLDVDIEYWSVVIADSGSNLILWSANQLISAEMVS
jgi:hypothetical protein